MKIEIVVDPARPQTLSQRVAPAPAAPAAAAPAGPAAGKAAPRLVSSWCRPIEDAVGDTYGDLRMVPFLSFPFMSSRDRSPPDITIVFDDANADG